MPNCVGISRIDHLPNETTILIRYVIGCTGTWDLEQTLTAYRSVCDTDWTLMSPNYQHPQHTDLPITITSPGYNATFAWNYGGIPGISSEDFNPSRSYLTQIGLYNLDCYYTGNPSNTGTTTGSNTGTTTGGGSNTGGGPIIIPIDPALPGYPRPTDPPVYVRLDPTWPDPDVGISVGGSEPDPNAGVSTDPVDPATGLAGSTGTTTGNHNQDPYYEPTPSVGVLIPTNTDPNIGVITTDPVIVSPSLVQYNQLYTQTNTAVTAPIPNVYVQTNTTGVSATRPNGTQVGTVDPMTYSQTYVSTNAVNTSQNTTGPIRTKFIFNKAVIDSPVLSNQDNTNGLERNLFGTTPMERIIGTSLDPNAYTSIMTPHLNVFKGSPIPISIVSYPSTPTICKLEVYVQDSKTSIKIGSTEYSLSSEDNPIKYAISFKSGIATIGNVLFTAKLVDLNGNAISVKTISVSNIDKTNTTTSGTYSNRTNISYQDLPSRLSNYSTNSLYEVDTSLDLLNTKYLIFTKVASSTNCLSLLTKGNITTDQIFIKVYNSDGAVYPLDGSGVLIQNSVVLINTSDRVKINNAYWFPETHNSGFLNYSVSNSEILVEIAPSDPTRSTSAKVYISNNYRLRTPSIVIFNSGNLISGTIPYALEDCGLIVYGKTPGFIGNTYTIHKATSNRAGSISFYDVNILKGEYFAIFTKTNGTYNPHNNIIYSGQY